MKEIFLTLMVLLIFSPAYGASIVCDVPATRVDTYILYNNGVEIARDIPAETDWSLKFDAASLPPGQVSLTAAACNERGCSDASAPLLLPAKAGIPGNLKLQP